MFKYYYLNVRPGFHSCFIYTNKLRVQRLTKSWPIHWPANHIIIITIIIIVKSIIITTIILKVLNIYSIHTFISQAQGTDLTGFTHKRWQHNGYGI